MTNNKPIIEADMTDTEIITIIEQAAKNSTNPFAAEQLETARMFRNAYHNHICDIRRQKAKANSEEAYMILANMLRLY